ncbi:MAG: 3-dehydroquinate synthase [Candidatus Marinimicrobia bacterium]|nr:3-dehydroquinate synthase [Candidatus Neomarinimicrobiota bacterium]MBL7022887.1 3-dehydroquinate synthase [Candidatus Neomarinimicrobiota bacterium]MBL7109206.1 3-dehydroquinate synthase [Candidatus Neomarinimicrobiota bacterium]
MQTIDVKLKSNPYQIFVETHLFDKISNLLKVKNSGQKWVIVTHPSLEEIYGNKLQILLSKHSFDVSIITIPEGENSKSFIETQNLYSQLLKLNCDRSSTLIALGGGVIGDITGFVASTFMRGIEFIQIPTTLLAMVDSSVGGKTGINLDEGKNLVGTFHQPKAVFIDPILLGTLPNRDMVSGMAEVIKYGVIKDKSLFQLVSHNLDEIISLSNIDLLEDIIIKSCKIKAEIVVADEQESNHRRILNFGHTIGHALENILGYDTLRHGEAVAYGMICAGELSKKYANLSEDNFKLLEETIRQLHLHKLPDIEHYEILKSIKNDKKNERGELSVILIESIGDAIINQDVTDGDIANSIKYIKNN